VFLLVAVLAGGGWYLTHRHRTLLRESYQQLLASEPGLAPTTAPCGWSADALAGRWHATPEGDRRYGLRHGVEGPTTLTLLGGEHEVTCAAFEWWSEQRRTSRTQHGTSTRYVERRCPAVVVRLPVAPASRITLGPESALGRVGLTRGGQQLESSEFNRRFRVDVEDPTLGVTLLDANLQQRLLEAFRGRTIEVDGDLLVLGGAPSHRDPRYRGVVGELSAVRQDAVRLLESVPPQFWRACGLGREET
jgi:hypothetical protein